MNIIKKNFQWNGSLTPIRKHQIDGIALHHMAHETADIDTVHKWHLDRGWAGIGYNYWVGLDGAVYEGRGMHVGAHIGGHNSHLLGIGFQGHFERGTTVMSDAQYNAGVRLIKWLQQQIPTARIVNGHKYWAATACPGKYFPLYEMMGLNERKPKVGIEEGEDTMQLTDWQWDMLYEVIPKLNLDSPGMWMDKVKDRTITSGELAWLSAIVLSRYMEQ